MKLGESVKCHAFIKSSRNHYEIGNQNGICDFWAAGAKESLAIEDEHSCDRFNIIQKEFSGIFVGLTIFKTRINVEYVYNGYRAYCDAPKEFAVVYYANNKKRYVPINMVEEISE